MLWRARPFDGPRQRTDPLEGANYTTMTGSMYAAIAGLQTHMQKMNVIGNNIANANTYGFKPGVTTFTESLYTSIASSTAGGNQYGGTNAAQIGYGSQVASIDLNMSAGSYAMTGVPSHLYLNGNGFFLVGPKAEGQPDPNQLTLKRVGNFKLDSDGYLVDENGYCVYGFMPQGDPATGEMMYQTGTDEPLWDTCLRPLRVPVAGEDADGKQVPLYQNPEATGNGNAADGETGLADPTAPTLPQGVAYDRDNIFEDAQSLNMTVDNNGVITLVTQNNVAVTIGVIAIGSVINPNGLTKENEGYYTAGNNAGNVTVGTCGQVVMGNLNNVQDGGNVVPTELTGAGSTTILSGGLESSKTDIATEFADLITTQRGFQANTKIITVTDEMLSDLVSMKR